MDGLATAESLIVEAGPSITSPAQQPDSESYVYEELNPRGSIRLLQLAPGRPDDPLEGTIVTVCPENVDQIRYKGSAKYRAVSYTWYEEENGSTIGKAEASKEIFCQGKSLPISRNLYNLLKRLRENEPYEKYWIDQICIDQGNEQEKEHQITLMRQIYQDAEFVIFWIGEENEDTGKVFDLVEKLAAIFISVQKSLQPLPGGSKILDDAYLSSLGLPGHQEHEWKALMQVLSRQVYQRMWIVQEITVADSTLVLCGSYTLDFIGLGFAAHLLTLTQWIRHFQFTYSSIIARCDYIGGLFNRRADYISETEQRLDLLLLSTRRCKSTMDQDKVYALVGLFADRMNSARVPDELVPNYSKPVSEVFRDATLHLLRLGLLNILSGVEDSSVRKTPNLPSWVPDYAVFQGSTIFGMPNMEAIRKYNASGDSPVKLTWLASEPELLTIRAKKVADIVMRGASLETQDKWSLYLFLDKCAKVVNVSGVYPGGGSPVDALWRTLISNFPFSTEGPAPDDYLFHFKKYLMEAIPELKRMEGYLEALAETEEPESGVEIQTIPFECPGLQFLIQYGNTILYPSDIRAFAPGLLNVLNKVFAIIMESHLSSSVEADDSLYAAALENSSFFRRFFYTSGEYMGIGPKSLATGDEIFVISGARVPFVLRKFGENKYRLIGECYVHGLMNGESVKHANGWEDVCIY